MQWYRGLKPVGSVVQYRTGYIYVKTSDGWKAESRVVAELKLVKRELEQGEKVFHRDGDRTNNRPENLAVIKFNPTKYRLLPGPNLIHLPKPQVTEKELARR